MAEKQVDSKAAAANTGKKKQAGRSPNFPSLSLEKAIEKTKKLDPHPTAISLVPSRWGYSNTKNGAFIQILATIKAYGLVKIDGEGEKRVITISESGNRIIKNAPDREELIKKSALLPSTIRELWIRYKDFETLPKDDIIKNYLIWERKPPFLPTAADSFINVFRDTIGFAKLAESDIVRAPDDGESDSKTEENGGNIEKNDAPKGPAAQAAKKDNLYIMQMPTPLSPTYRPFTLPLMGGEVAILQVPHPMSEASFNVLQAVLTAMKAALVSQPAQQPKGENNA